MAKVTQLIEGLIYNSDSGSTKAKVATNLNLITSALKQAGLIFISDKNLNPAAKEVIAPNDVRLSTGSSGQDFGHWFKHPKLNFYLGFGYKVFTPKNGSSYFTVSCPIVRVGLGILNKGVCTTQETVSNTHNINNPYSEHNFGTSNLWGNCSNDFMWLYMLSPYKADANSNITRYRTAYSPAITAFGIFKFKENSYVIIKGSDFSGNTLDRLCYKSLMIDNNVLASKYGLGIASTKINPYNATDEGIKAMQGFIESKGIKYDVPLGFIHSGAVLDGATINLSFANEAKKPYLVAKGFVYGSN